MRSTGIASVVDRNDDASSGIEMAPPTCTICKAIVGFLQKTFAKNQTKDTITGFVSMVSFLSHYFNTICLILFLWFLYDDWRVQHYRYVSCCQWKRWRLTVQDFLWCLLFLSSLAAKSLSFPQMMYISPLFVLSPYGFLYSGLDNL